MRILSPAVVVAVAALAGASPASAQTLPATQPETRRVSVTWEAAPLREVLQAFATFSGASIVAGAGVDGFVTADINNQPWDVALEAILGSLGLFAVEEQSGIIRVQSMADAAARETVEPILTRSYRLSFARASEVQGALAPILSERGAISILESTNTVVVSDIARVHQTIAALLQ
jgi:type II secretory pathway component GspD/PulD (secretin)